MFIWLYLFGWLVYVGGVLVCDLLGEYMVLLVYKGGCCGCIGCWYCGVFIDLYVFCVVELVWVWVCVCCVFCLFRVLVWICCVVFGVGDLFRVLDLRFIGGINWLVYFCWVMKGCSFVCCGDYFLSGLIVKRFLIKLMNVMWLFIFVKFKLVFFFLFVYRF